MGLLMAVFKTKCNCGPNILVKEILQNGKSIQKN